MGVNFHYGLHEGWARCGLTVDSISVFHSVNGWHDGLREIVLAACEMFGRANEATAYFQEEPGEFRWRISRLTVNRIRVRVIEFDDWGTGRPDEVGKLLFDKPCGVMAFATAVYNGSGEWLAELERSDPARIKTGFPRAEYERLGDILQRHDYSGPPSTRTGV
jgi:hypothetical protein